MSRSGRTSTSKQKARANVVETEAPYKGPAFDEEITTAYENIRRKPQSFDAKASIAALTDTLPAMVDDIDAFSDQPWVPVARSIMNLFGNLSQSTGYDGIELQDTTLVSLLDGHYLLSGEQRGSHDERMGSAVALTVLSALSYTAMRSNGADVTLADFACTIVTPQAEGIAA